MTSSLPADGKPFPIDPSKFTTEIDNPYWPMKPGSHWVFRETNAEGSVSRVVVTVLDKTKMIANGVEARIVHDQVSAGGQVKEDTYDWYAQDAAGNLWYLGEDTTEYENGKPKTKEGSWEAGVDGARPGIIMPADPQVGMIYREEYYEGHAEDGASIISTDAHAKVPVRTVRARCADPELQRHRARRDRGEDLRAGRGEPYPDLLYDPSHDELSRRAERAAAQAAELERGESARLLAAPLRRRYT